MDKENKKISISAFLDENGRVAQIPTKNKKKIVLLAYLTDKFDKNKIYSEKEVNVIINEWHTFGDYFIIRRLLIDYGFMKRTSDGEKYWLNELY